MNGSVEHHAIAGPAGAKPDAQSEILPAATLARPIGASIFDLLGYRRTATHVDITLPVGLPFADALLLLNREAQARGMAPLLDEREPAWEWIESRPALRTEPGNRYSMPAPFPRIATAEMRPGAVALAEACERIAMSNDGSLMQGPGYLACAFPFAYEVLSDRFGVRLNT